MNPVVWHRIREYVRAGDLIALGIVLGRGIRVVQLDRVTITQRAVLDDPRLRKFRERRPDLRARLAGQEDASRMSRAFQRTEEVYSKRLAEGEICVLVEGGSGPAAAEWLKIDHGGAVDEIGCRVILPPDACWAHDTYVLPEERLRGAFAVIKHEVMIEAGRRGKTVILGTTTHTNPASFQAHTRAGFEAAAVITRLRVGTFDLFWIRAAHRKGTRFVAGARRSPDLPLPPPIPAQDRPALLR